MKIKFGICNEEFMNLRQNFHYSKSNCKIYIPDIIYILISVLSTVTLSQINQCINLDLNLNLNLI